MRLLTHVSKVWNYVPRMYKGIGIKDQTNQVLASRQYELTLDWYLMRHTKRQWLSNQDRLLKSVLSLVYCCWAQYQSGK